MLNKRILLSFNINNLNSILIGIILIRVTFCKQFNNYLTTFKKLLRECLVLASTEKL